MPPTGTPIPTVKSKTSWAKAALIICVTVVVCIAGFLEEIHQPKKTPIITCNNDLKRLAFAVSLYAGKHGGLFPPDLTDAREEIIQHIKLRFLDESENSPLIAIEIIDSSNSLPGGLKGVYYSADDNSGSYDAETGERRGSYAHNSWGVKIQDKKTIRYATGVPSFCVDKIPVDPWGNPYIYNCPGTDGNVFVLFSRGPDGKHPVYFKDANLAPSVPCDAIDAIYEVAKRGDLKMAKALIRANPQVVFRTTCTDSSTLLHGFAGEEYSGKDIVEMLLTYNVDVNAKDYYGNTSLNLAAVYNHKDVAELLLANKADVNAKDNRGLTPLHSAIARIGTEGSLIPLLLANHADVNAKDNKGRTPLHVASLISDAKDEMVLLLANNAEVNAKNYEGDTPLHCAAGHGFTQMAELLLANHAEVNAKNYGGMTPLHVAVYNERKEVVEVLLANKADVNAKDNYHSTPLFWAKGRRTDVAELLRQHGGHE